MRSISEKTFIRHAAKSEAFCLEAVVTFAILSCCLPAGAQEKSSASETPEKAADSTALEAMRRRARSLVVRKAGDAADATTPLQNEPLLHYSDPGGITTDATLWAWGKSGRPLALAAIFFEKLPSNLEKWSCELTALSDARISVESKAGWEWAPNRSDVDLKVVPDAPVPVDNGRQRSRQMNDIARRFTVSETFSAERTDQLRLMPRAVYRYSDPEDGLIDGALYAFASGTNPEALLLVEGRKTPENGAWHYAFARLGAAQLQATLGDTLVWRCPGIERWSADEPYYSVFGTDSEVFPSTLDPEPKP